MRQVFEEKCDKAKADYYINTVEDLKNSNPNQWYSKVKRMGGISGNHTGDIQVEELDGLSNANQASASHPSMFDRAWGLQFVTLAKYSTKVDNKDLA